MKHFGNAEIGLVRPVMPIPFHGLGETRREIKTPQEKNGGLSRLRWPLWEK